MLKEYLKSHKIFSDEEIEEIIQLGKLVQYTKDDFLIKEGEISKNIAFIYSGILRSYYHNQAGDEITYCFSFAESFTTAYSSYISQEPSSIYIQALTPTKLIVIPKFETDKLLKKNRNWLLFQKQIAEHYFMALEKRVFEHQQEKAETRYLKLLKNKPEYMQQIPLQYVASYIGITQRHLSRIRANTAF